MNGNSESIIYRRLLSNPHDGYKKSIHKKYAQKKDRFYEWIISIG